MQVAGCNAKKEATMSAMKIIVDTREQAPFTFAHERYQVELETGALALGDYSLAGLSDRVAVERKSLADLVQFSVLAGSVSALSASLPAPRRWTPLRWWWRPHGLSWPKEATGAA